MWEAITHTEFSFQKLLLKWVTLENVYRIQFPLNSEGKLQILRCLPIIYKTKLIYNQPILEEPFMLKFIYSVPFHHPWLKTWL